MHSITTVLIETSTILRECLSDHLIQKGFPVAATAASAKDIEFQFSSRSDPDLIIIGTRDDDAWLKENIQALRARFCESHIVVLADQYDLNLVQTAFRYSARAFLMKTIDCSTLIKSLELVMLGELELVMHGQGMFRSAILTQTPKPEELDIEAEYPLLEDRTSAAHASRKLSSREMQILRCLVQGQSNKIIARNLDIVEATVKVHIKAILRKIRVQNRTQAAIWAVNRLDRLSVSLDAERLNAGSRMAHASH